MTGMILQASILQQPTPIMWEGKATVDAWSTHDMLNAPWGHAKKQIINHRTLKKKKVVKQSSSANEIC